MTIDRMLLNENTGEETVSQPISFSVSLLALLLTMQMSGVLVVISQMGRFFLWSIWLLMWSLILMNGFTLLRLPNKAKLFIGWLILYCIWGLLVSPLPDWDQALRSLFYALTAAASLTVVSRDRSSWNRLSFFASWAIILNLAVALAFINISGVRHWMFAHDIGNADYQWSIHRFWGLFRDPNEAGMLTNVFLVLTLWSSGRLIWVVRAAAVWFIYLTASRTSTYCLLIVGGLCLFYSVGHTQRGRFIAIALVCLVLFGVFLEMDPMSWFHRYENNTRFWARILDPLEHQSTSRYTRYDLAKLWIRYIEHAPWYGYGLNAMRGGASREGLFRSDIPYIGPHNMFMGMYIDAGIPGLISYLALLTVGAVATIRAKLEPLERTALLCMWAILLVFNMFLAALHLELHSLVLYFLVFMFPYLPIFQEQVDARRK